MDKVIKLKTRLFFYLLLLIMLIFCSCSAFQELFSGKMIQRPTVEFARANLTGLSFDKADLLFDLKIQNPNRLGIKLAGFDYELLINNGSFIKGERNEGLEIKAEGAETIQLPLSLRYLDIYQTFRSLIDQDNSIYRLNCGFSFNIPVLGAVRIPVSKEGDIPLLKLPAISLDSLKLKSLNLSGADMLLRVKVKNPNALSMVFEGMKYQLNISGQRWVSGDARDNITVNKGESLVDIPVSLDFLRIGQSVYQIINKGKNLDYQFTGDLNLMTSMTLLGRVNLPFDLSGKIDVLKQ